MPDKKISNRMNNKKCALQGSSLYPIIPRMQCLFRCSILDQFMDYHAHNRSQDEFIQIIVNGSKSRDKGKEATLKKNLIILGFHWQ